VGIIYRNLRDLAHAWGSDGPSEYRALSVLPRDFETGLMITGESGLSERAWSGRSRRDIKTECT